MGTSPAAETPIALASAFVAEIERASAAAREDIEEQLRLAQADTAELAFANMFAKAIGVWRQLVPFMKPPQRSTSETILSYLHSSNSESYGVSTDYDQAITRNKTTRRM